MEMENSQNKELASELKSKISLLEERNVRLMEDFRTSRTRNATQRASSSDFRRTSQGSERKWRD